MSTAPPPPGGPPSRRGDRDYAAEYAWRVRGTEPGTWQRSSARGHRGIGELEDLMARRGDEVEAFLTVDYTRSAGGQIIRVEVLVILADGSQQMFVLRGKSALQVSRLGPLVSQLPPGVPVGKAISYLLRESEYEAYIEEPE